MKCSLTILCLTLLLTHPVSAGTRVWVDRSNVQACLPLPGGRLLKGSRGGLSMVQGVNRAERSWTRLDGLPGTSVFSLLRSGQNVWVGTEQGLAEMVLSDQGELTLRSAVATAAVRAMALHRGKLYLATWGGGALRYDPRTQQMESLAYDFASIPPPAPATRLTSVASVDSTIYFGTAGGGVWLLKSGRLRAMPENDHLPSQHVWSLAVGPAGSLLMGTLAGVAIRSSDGKLERLSVADARSVSLLGDQRILVGTYGEGLLRLEKGRARAIPGAGKYINSITQHHGITCVGTRDGVRVRRGPGQPFSHLRLPGLPSNDISAMAVDGRRLWVGTFDQGLAYIEEGQVGYLPHGLMDDRINALAVARQGQQSTLWVGTSRGLCRVRAARQPSPIIRCFQREHGLRSVEVHAIIPLSRGGVLAGTGRGAVIIRNEQVSMLGVKQGLPVASIWAAAEDSDGSLWLGTSRGLYHWRDGRYHRYSVSSNHLTEDYITAITLHKGAVYAGTYNNGVTRLRRGRDGQWVGRHLGGGWINFNGLRIHGSRLHAATMTGLRIKELDQDSAWQERTRAAPGRDVTAVAVMDGRLHVASRRGLALHPAD